MNTISPWSDATTINWAKDAQEEKIWENLKAFVERRTQQAIDRGATPEEIGLEFRIEAVYVKVGDKRFAEFSLGAVQAEFDENHIVDHRYMSGYWRS